MGHGPGGYKTGPYGYDSGGPYSQAHPYQTQQQQQQGPGMMGMVGAGLAGAGAGMLAGHMVNSAWGNNDGGADNEFAAEGGDFDGGDGGGDFLAES